MTGKRMKILYIIPAEGFGGAERQAILHIINLPHAGIDVVAVTGPGRKVYDRIEGKSYHCPWLPGEYGKPFRLYPFMAYACGAALSWIRSIAFLAKIHREENVDLVFAGRVAGWSLAAALSLLFGTPAVWRFGSRVQGRFRRCMLKALACVSKPAAVVSNCKAVDDSIAGIVTARRFIVPNGIDLRRFDSASAVSHLREKIRLDAAIPIIGLAIRPSPDKGMDFLLDVAGVMSSRGDTAHFCIAGEFGWRGRIESERDKRGLSGSVSFLGHVDDMVSFFAGCDIVALTSRQHSIEGLPNSLLEAMALKRPVVATAVGGVPELIEHGKNGILVGNPDPRLFADELVALIRSPARRRRLGAAAAETVRRSYSMERAVQALAASVIAATEGQSRTLKCRASSGHGRSWQNHRFAANPRNRPLVRSKKKADA